MLFSIQILITKVFKKMIFSAFGKILVLVNAFCMRQLLNSFCLKKYLPELEMYSMYFFKYSMYVAFFSILEML